MEASHNCKVVATNGVKVRPAPNTNNTSTATWPLGYTFQISEIVPDSIDPNNTGKKWGHIFGGSYDGLYVALEYTGTPSHLCDYTPILTPPPTPTPEGAVKVEVNIPPTGEVTVKVNDVLYVKG